MTSDLDVYRSAHALIQLLGSEAAIQAAKRADELMNACDLDGAAEWRRIVAAIKEMQRVEPATGERRH